jgi:hypothetical protein
VWTGSSNAVQLQIYATLMFYAVLLTICQQVAQVLGDPWSESRWRWCFVPSITTAGLCSVASVTIWEHFWPSMPNSWVSSSGSVSSTASVRN